jgi:hypothetical protein
MDMVFFAVTFDKSGVEVIRNGGEGGAQAFQCIIIQRAAAILCDKDQMHMQVRNNMSSLAIFYLEPS